MASLFDSPSFWRERFNPYSEYGFLNFMLDKSNKLLEESKDWRQIYHSVRVPALKGNFKNSSTMFPTMLGDDDYPPDSPFEDDWLVDRYWIWKRMHWLRDMLFARMIPNTPSQKVSSNQDSLKLKEFDWRAHSIPGSCTIECQHDCRSAHRPQQNQAIRVPQPLSKIAVWATEPDRFITTYPCIVGIELITGDMSTSNVGVGYCNLGQKFTVDIDPSEKLSGFEVSLTDERFCGRIQAIRICTSPLSDNRRENKSKWLGFPLERDYNTKRLCTTKPISALRAGFSVGSAIFCLNISINLRSTY